MRYLGIVIVLIASVAHAAGPTREELAIKPSGPVMMSPWRLAAEQRSSPHWNQYCYSAPVGFYSYGYNGYAYGWYGPWRYRGYWSCP